MAYIGNRHNQPIVTALFFGVNRIVEVTRGFAVYRYQRQVAQIDAVFDVLRPDMIGNVFCGLQTGFAENMRQLVFAYGDFDFHATVGIVAQHFNQFGNRRAVAVRVAFDFCYNYLAGFGFQLGQTFRLQHDALG